MNLTNISPNIRRIYSYLNSDKFRELLKYYIITLSKNFDWLKTLFFYHNLKKKYAERLCIFYLRQHTTNTFTRFISRHSKTFTSKSDMWSVDKIQVQLYPLRHLYVCKSVYKLHCRAQNILSFILNTVYDVQWVYMLHTQCQQNH